MEYKAEMFRNGKWTIAAIPFGGELSPIADNKPEINRFLLVCKDMWEKAKKENFSFKGKVPEYARMLIPTDFRIVSREVSDWTAD